MSEGVASPLSEPDRVDEVMSRIRARGGAATIYDIAELAGVNPSTVSRALGKPGRISAATAGRVHAAAAALEFRINPAARALQTGKTGMLGLVVADITNPVVFDVVRGAEHEAAAAGYTLVIAESQESGENESEVIERLLPSVDGLVLATTRLPPAKIEDIARRKSVVLINKAVENVPSLVADVETGVEEVIEHLAVLGHSSLVFLAGPPTSWINARRWGAILVAAERRGLAIVEIGPNRPTIDGGKETMRRVLASRATAVIAYNDLMAIGLMQALQGENIAVPDRMSVVGFDDIFGSELIVPALTTVRTDLEAAGRQAVAMTLRDRSESATPPTSLLPTQLVVRGSTGPHGH